MSRRKLRITFNAPAILGFALICCIATALGSVTRGASTRLLFSTYAAPMSDILMYVRLFGHSFGHADPGHLVANMSYLLLVGPMLEEKYGTRTMIALMAIVSVVTGIINNLLFPHTMLLGASGICFALILLASFSAFREGEVPLTFILVAVIYLGQQVMDGLLTQDRISQSSHLVGGVIGAWAGYTMNRKMSGRT